MSLSPINLTATSLACDLIAPSIVNKDKAESRSQLVKCLHIINGEHYSGAERVQDLFGLSMPEFGYDVEFAALKNGKFAANRRSTCPFHLERMSSRWDRSITNRLIQLAEDNHYQILHAHTPRTLMVGAAVAKRMGLPLVYHVHSPVGKDSTRWLQNKINTFVEKRSLRQANRLIAVSDSVGQYMNQLGYGPDRLTVVPNGVPVVSDQAQAELAAQQVWQSPWEFTLGTVALFRPRKGTEVLLQSLAKLAQQGLDVGVLAVGGFETSDYENQLKNLAAELKIEDRVHWTGFTREVNPYYPVMDLFVLPSLFGEGLPMVVLESMAMGIPVVASRVEGIEQAIRPGRDGAIAIPGDADDLAQQLAKLLSAGDLQQMGQSARDRQRQCFSDKSMCQATADVYSQLLD